MKICSDLPSFQMQTRFTLFRAPFQIIFGRLEDRAHACGHGKVGFRLHGSDDVSQVRGQASALGRQFIFVPGRVTLLG
jgi:hypothetical protein